MAGKGMRPRLLRSGLTGAVYVVTRYTEPEPGRFVAQTKYDVTDDFNALLEELADENERGDVS